MPTIHADAIRLEKANGGVLVTYTSGGEEVPVFILRSAFMAALAQSNNLVADLEAEDADVTVLQTGEI